MSEYLSIEGKDAGQVVSSERCRHCLRPLREHGYDGKRRYECPLGELHGRRVKVITRRDTFGVVSGDHGEWVTVEINHDDRDEFLFTPRENVRVWA